MSILNIALNDYDAALRARRSEAAQKAAQTRRNNTLRAQVESRRRIDAFQQNPSAGEIIERLTSVVDNFSAIFDAWIDEQIEDALAQVKAIEEQYGSEAVLAAYESGEAQATLGAGSYFTLYRLRTSVLKLLN